MQMDQIRNLFTGDFIQQYLSSESGPLDQSQPSLSMPHSLINADYPSSFLDMLSKPYMPDTFNEVSSYQVTEPTPLVIPPHQLAMQSHAQSHSIRLPTPASDDEAMIRAMLSVLSSHSLFSSSYGSQQTQTFQHQISDGTGAFKPYDPALDLMAGTRPNSHGQYRIKLVFAILRSIYSTSREPWMQEIQQKRSQLHHIITERRRREKINEGFQELILLLPRVWKKDRISVLSNTREYLSALKVQLVELKDKNRMLETQVSLAREDREDSDTQIERVVIQAVGASSEPLSAEERQIELRVRVREEDCDMGVLVRRILECLKQMKDISIVSLEAHIQLHHTNRWNRVIFRLKIKVYIEIK
ncbi:putative transcription factor bHLH041 [Magnolia sinica]|uniref:putative transcription factor bHLH041 n=1 Tax=Magnolia sinica TaxID=86752 RepID=UPI002657B714|nr:putative transcription factor bHLH041 [Magnolia sinica]